MKMKIYDDFAVEFYDIRKGEGKVCTAFLFQKR